MCQGHVLLNARMMCFRPPCAPSNISFAVIVVDVVCGCKHNHVERVPQRRDPLFLRNITTITKGFPETDCCTSACTDYHNHPGSSITVAFWPTPWCQVVTTSVHLSPWARRVVGTILGGKFPYTFSESSELVFYEKVWGPCQQSSLVPEIVS